MNFDFIEFVDIEENDSNISRAPQLPWWASFIDNTQRLKLSNNKGGGINSTTKLRTYLDRLLPTLYIAKHGLGINLDTEVEKAKPRLKDSHRIKLKRVQEANIKR